MAWTSNYRNSDVPFPFGQAEQQKLVPSFFHSKNSEGHSTHQTATSYLAFYGAACLPVKELAGSAPCRASVPKGFVGTCRGDKQPLARKPPERRRTLPTPPLPPAIPSSPRPARQSEVRTPEKAYRRIATVPRGDVRREPAACSAGPLPARRFPAEPGARS